MQHASSLAIVQQGRRHAAVVEKAGGGEEAEAGLARGRVRVS